MKIQFTLPTALALAPIALALNLTFSLTACTSTAPAIHRTGTVTRALGNIPITPGTPCTVDLTPETRAGLNCRVSIHCGSRDLFGGAMLGGYANCEIRNGQYVTASDRQLSSRDGDPAVDVRLANRSVTVRDDRPDHVVAIALNQ